MVKYPLSASHFTQSVGSGKFFLQHITRDMFPKDIRYPLLLDWLRTDLGRAVEYHCARVG